MDKNLLEQMKSLESELTSIFSDIEKDLDMEEKDNKEIWLEDNTEDEEDNLDEELELEYYLFIFKNKNASKSMGCS